MQQLLNERLPHWAMLTEGKEKSTAPLWSSQDSFPRTKTSLIWALRANFLVQHSGVSFSELSAIARISSALSTC